MQLYQEKSIPPGAWDTHVHVFEPQKFPYGIGRHYTPACATLAQLQLFHASIGVEHVCFAHGFAYGSDCTSLLHNLERFPGVARGICVFDTDTVTDSTLDAYHAAGVRSVRVDFFRAAALHNVDAQVQMIKAVSARLERWGKGRWSIQIQQPHLEFWSHLQKLGRELSFPLVVDHFALIEAHSMRNNGQPANTQPLAKPEGRYRLDNLEGFNHLLSALRHGNVWLKLSAPYRCSDLSFTYDDLQPYVRAFVEANAERIIWGSDWPHTQRHAHRNGKDPSVVEQFQTVDSRAWIASLSRWLSEDEWQQMWIANPRELYEA